MKISIPCLFPLPPRVLALASPDRLRGAAAGLPDHAAIRTSRRLPGAAQPAYVEYGQRGQHRGAAQPDAPAPAPAAAAPWPAAWSAAWSATSSAMAAAAPRPPRWAWSAVRLLGNSIEAKQRAARLRELPRLDPDRQRRLPLLRCAEPGRPARRRSRAHRTAGRSRASERASRRTAKSRAVPGFFSASVRQCSGSLPGAIGGTLKKPVPGRAAADFFFGGFAHRAHRQVEPQRDARQRVVAVEHHVLGIDLGHGVERVSRACRDSRPPAARRRRRSCLPPCLRERGRAARGRAAGR